MAIDNIARGLSKINAIKYGSIGIQYVEANASGTGFLFYMAGLSNPIDVPVSAFSFMFTPKYDITKTGNSVDKAQTLKNNTDSTWNDGSYYLNRDNHTGTQKANTITIDKTGFKEFCKAFAGTTVQDLATYLDTHKEFINGLFIGDSTKEGSFKLVVNNSKLEYQRLENGVWKTIETVGYLITDKLELNSSYSTIDFKLDDKELNLAKITTDENSVQVGDARLDKLILAGKELSYRKIEDTNTSYNYIVNNDASLTQNVSNWEFVVNIPSQNNYLHCAIYAVDLNNTTTGYYKYTITDVLTNNVVYYTGSDFELKQGLTYNFTNTGLHTETLPKLVHLTCGRQYKITFTAQNQIGFKGGLIAGQFKPYLVIKYYFTEEDNVLLQKNISDSVSSNVSNTVASSKSVYTLAQAINSISGGMSPIIPITCEDFSVLTSGTNGTHYILTNDGSIDGNTVHKLDNIFMVNTFTGRTIVNTDYVIIPVNTNSKGNIYITNVEAINIGKNVTKTMNNYPNDGSVLSAMSDDNSYKITVEWDRGEEFCGQPKVNGKDIIGIINKAGGTYTGYVVLDSTDITSNKIIATLNSNIYTIAFSIVTPPSISSITFGNLPVGQTELKEGDIIDVTIVTDKDINTIEIEDTGAFQYQNISVTNGKTSIISGIIANRGSTLQNLKASIRVKSTEGSWSGITESIATLPLNNIKPIITLDSKTFSSGFSALKNSETCVVKVIASNYDTLTSSAIGTDLSVGVMSGLNCTVTRINGIYNDSMANLRITGTRNANGATNYLDVCVEIANVSPNLTNSSVIPKIRTGENDLVLCTFDQKIKITACSIITPNKGILTTGTLPTTSYDVSYSPYISASDTDNHSNNNLTMILTVVGMSGLTAVLSKYYIICGFQQKIITVVYPSTTADIPTIVNMGNLILSGVINSNPPYPICTTYANPTSAITDYNITGATLNLPPLGVLSGFYYNASNPIVITIEETV